MDLFIKDFEDWIEKKKSLHEQIKKPPFFKERDIWWISVGVNVGFEEDGKNKYYVPVTLKQNVVSVMTSQIRVFSFKRMWNKLAELDEGDYHKVVGEVKKFFVLPSSQKQGGRG